MNNSYNSLEEFRTARRTAREERDLARLRLATRWDMISDPGTRGALLKNALGDMLRSWAPKGPVTNLLSGRVMGSAVAAVGMAVASAQKGIGRRLLFSGLSMALGKVMGGRRQHGGFLSNVVSTVGRVAQFIHERKANGQERSKTRDASTVTQVDR